jgi:hypothetical protein
MRFPTKHRWIHFICLLMVVLCLPAASAADQPVPPSIEFQGVLSRDKIEKTDQVTLFLFLSNKSSIPVTWNAVYLISSGFAEEKRQCALPTIVPPFATVEGTLSLKADNTTAFGAQKILVNTNYIWTNGKQEMVTSQTATLPIELTRRFEEESKGFPGGTAAFFYLLLPVIPAFLSYQLLDGLRKGEKIKLPEFKAEYIVPAFLAAIVISFLMLIANRTDAPINYSDPQIFVEVLFTSLVAGATIPSLRWLWSWLRKTRWGFSSNEDAVSYLRKALLSPYRPETIEWVTGTAAGVEWQGFVLKQPNGNVVLGPQVSVTPEAKAASAFKKGKLIDAKVLIQLVKDKSVTVSVSDPVLRSNTALPSGQLVALEGLEGFEQTGAPTVKELVRPLS